MMAIGFSIRGDMDDLSATLFSIKRLEHPLGKDLTIVEEITEGDIMGNRTVVEKYSNGAP
jgi:hypothetical protein